MNIGCDQMENERQRKPKGQARMDNPETLTILDKTRHLTMTSKTQRQHNTENKNDEQHEPHQKLGMNPGEHTCIVKCISYHLRGWE